jgi:hypothetical protein
MNSARRRADVLVADLPLALELQPAFRYGRQSVGVDCAAALAAALGEALSSAGLPE